MAVSYSTKFNDFMHGNRSYNYLDAIPYINELKYTNDAKFSVLKLIKATYLQKNNCRYSRLPSGRNLFLLIALSHKALFSLMTGIR